MLLSQQRKCQCILLQQTQEQPKQSSKSVCLEELCVLIRCIVLIGQHMGKNLATRIAENQMSHKDNIICYKCHNTISKESIFTCLDCRNTVPKKYTYIFNKKTCSPLVCIIGQLDSSTSARQYICKNCHTNLLPKVTCVCC